MKYRADIDGLRAVAVLAVLVFHAFPGLLPSGFIGVDVFFVISGFLITGILLEELEQGSVSLAGFYARRIRRIFPALTLVMLISLLAAWLLLHADDYIRLSEEVAAGAGFWINFLLWKQSGYFDVAAASKPMLHLWSLAVEEQFYAVWPLLLLAVYARRLLPLMLCLSAGLSFAISVRMVAHAPDAAFYMPWSRFWELIIGGGLAWATAHKPDRFQRWSTALALSAVVLMLAGFVCIRDVTVFPGMWALLPVLGAACAIAVGPVSPLARLLASPLPVWFGRISYPLYLWHWPVLAIAAVVSGGMLERPVKLALLGLSVVLAWMTFEYVEKPVRKAGGVRIKVFLLCLTMLLIAGLAVFMSHGGLFRLTGRFYPVIPEADKRMPAVVSGNSFHFRDRTPRIMIYGDSQAADIYRALANDQRVGSQIFRADHRCAEFSMAAVPYPRMRQACREAFERLLASPGLREADVLIYTHLWWNDTRGLKSYMEALSEVRRVNPRIRILFFGYKPFITSQWVGMRKLMQHFDSSMPINDYLAGRAYVPEDDRVVIDLAARLGVGYVPVAKIFCAAGCPFYRDGAYGYIDQSHWTLAGARSFHERLVMTPFYRQLLDDASAGQADEQEFQ